MDLFEDRTGLVLIVIVLALLVMAVAAAVLFFRLLAKFRPVHDQLTPFGAKAAFWGALAYTLLPLDVLPDPFMGDDAGLLALALFYINRVLANLEDSDDSSRSGTTGDWGDDPGQGPTDIIGR